MGSEGESAHAWREIFGELKKRGVEHIDIVVAGDLSGIEDATRSVFPGADHQLCCVHAARNARTKVRRTDCSEVLTGLKAIYRADDQEEAERALSAFADTRKKRYPGLVRYWRENFPRLTAFLKYSEQVRPYIYTTNQLERTGKEVKRRTKTIEAFSSEESLISVLSRSQVREREALTEEASGI
jgi:transposase-like protein